MVSFKASMSLLLWTRGREDLRASIKGMGGW